MLLKKTHMPSACIKQTFWIVALNRYGNDSHSKRSRSNVPLKYASAQPILSEFEGSNFRACLYLADRRRSAELDRSPTSEVFLPGLQSAFFYNLLAGDSL